jgi:hypothetical protein
MRAQSSTALNSFSDQQLGLLRPLRSLNCASSRLLSGNEHRFSQTMMLLRSPRRDPRPEGRFL